MIGKFVQISRVPIDRRRAAQQRARTDVRQIVPQGVDTFRVQATDSYLDVTVPFAVDGADFYTVKFLE